MIDLPPVGKPRQAVTVDELSASIRSAIARAPELRNVAVRGELQNLKRHSSGHVYFSLLGLESRISAVLFRSNASSVISWPRDGDEVMVTGHVDVYAKSGSYQIYATRLLPIGLGAKERAKAELRAALEKEGLFDPRHKRPIPTYPGKVAVVTSPTGAAFQDILKVSSDRSPFVDIVLIPAVVQGVDAPRQVPHALAAASAIEGLDCLILARGGGARDDLSPFDDEKIVRAVRSCPVPVITGLGHQIDNTLSDLAADAALPTPSAAAERVFPDSSKIFQRLGHVSDFFSSAALRMCEKREREVDRGAERLARGVDGILRAAEADLEKMSAGMALSMEKMIQNSESALAAISSGLEAFSPLSVLGRGYSICRDASGGIVLSAGSLSPGDEISLQFKDGIVCARVESVRKKELFPDTNA